MRKSISPESFLWLCLVFHKSLHSIDTFSPLQLFPPGFRSSKRRCTALPNHIQSLFANGPVIITWQGVAYTMTLSIWRDFHMMAELQMSYLKEWRSEWMLRTYLCPAVGNVLIRTLGGWIAAVPLNDNEWILQRSCAPWSHLTLLSLDVKDDFKQTERCVHTSKDWPYAGTFCTIVILLAQHATLEHIMP